MEKENTRNSVIENIVAEWEKDARLVVGKIAEQSLQTPQLHSKYLRILAQWKVKRTETQVRLNEIRHLKTRYYNNELSDKELQENNLTAYQYRKPLKNELEQLLSADNSVNRVQTQIELIDTVIYILEKILEQIKSRDFTISNYLKAQAYSRGETL